MGRKHPYPKEFREDAVRLAQESDKTVTEVADDLGLDPGTLFTWIRRAKASEPSPLTESERAELVALRRRVKTLETEREILKKAAAFFAREDDPTT